jgi:hypothetical protein
MEPEGSLLHSQQPATCPYPEHELPYDSQTKWSCETELSSEKYSDLSSTK